MYKLLRRFLPKWLSDTIMVLWFAGLIVLIFVFWEGTPKGFHYIEI